MSLDAPKETAIAGAPFTVGIVAARFNPALVDALLVRTLAVLAAAGVKEKRITVVRVPGFARGAGGRPMAGTRRPA
jgi:6,7-dimethyl-8-ribityllumazine synthase